MGKVGKGELGASRPPRRDVEEEKEDADARVLSYARFATVGRFCPGTGLLLGEVDESSKKNASAGLWVSSWREPVGLL